MFLLVNPHEATHGGIYSHPPLGVMYLESALIKAGVQCLITDGYLWGFEGIRDAIEIWQPDYVGITALTPGRHKTLEIANYAKNRGCMTVLGGVHFTWMWRQVMDHYPFVDIIVLGEGEEAIAEIGKGKHPSEIRGIVWRDGNIIVKNPARPYIQNLDTIPFPRWDWMMPQIPQYVAKGGGGPRLVFSRGCTGQCKFCSTTAFWRGWRCRSPSNFADEVEWLASLGCPHFCLADDAFSLDSTAAKEMLRELARRQLPIAFYATSRPDAFDEELCHLLRAARCDHVSMGLESGSQAILDRMGKQNTVEQNRQIIKWCKQAGLKVTALMIEGNVGETAQTIAETRRFLNETKPEGMGSVKDLWILPGTRFYKEMCDAGKLNDDFWLGPEPYYVYRGELDGPGWRGGHFL